jgi:hypothetical protein
VITNVPETVPVPIGADVVIVYWNVPAMLFPATVPRHVVRAKVAFN